MITYDIKKEIFESRWVLPTNQDTIKNTGIFHTCHFVSVRLTFEGKNQILLSVNEFLILLIYSHRVLEAKVRLPQLAFF